MKAEDLSHLVGLATVREVFCGTRSRGGEGRASLRGDRSLLRDPALDEQFTVSLTGLAVGLEGMPAFTQEGGDV